MQVKIPSKVERFIENYSSRGNIEKIVARKSKSDD